MMIAALAGTIPAKNRAIMITVASTARITSTRLASTLGRGLESVSRHHQGGGLFICPGATSLIPPSAPIR